MWLWCNGDFITVCPPDLASIVLLKLTPSQVDTTETIYSKLALHA